ncbi:predicted protein [Histoplasma capsulatum H143]|uniref:Uncharacterized protein n=1 Tax=Ajellomyces capsulatus (strain H143) TaxID=544712 RepID=C6H4A3_AJECH|nr:predicted protein [Histoplasma capsulatum H143]
MSFAAAPAVEIRENDLIPDTTRTSFPSALTSTDKAPHHLGCSRTKPPQTRFINSPRQRRRRRRRPTHDKSRRAP